MGVRTRSHKAMTLIELLACCVVVSILLAMVLGTVGRVRRSAHEAVCANNLRQLALALEVYNHDHDRYPPDAPEGQWLTDIAPYLEDSKELSCPEDPLFPASSSYESFYVLRAVSEEDTTRFVLGCPRHRGGALSKVLYVGRQVHSVTTETVQWTLPDGLTTRTMAVGDVVSGGTLAFVDGSTAQLDDGLDVRVLQTFRMSDGTLYTVLRVLDGAVGTISCNVTPGSRFEVVTPAIIAGAEGTEFWVDTWYDASGVCYTDYRVTEGAIWVMRKSTGQRFRMRAVAQDTTVTLAPPDTHTHWHCHRKDPDDPDCDQFLLHRHEHAIQDHHPGHGDAGWHFPEGVKYRIRDKVNRAKWGAQVDNSDD